MIDNNLNSLNKTFLNLVLKFLIIVRKKYPNVAPFETGRTLARQKRLKSMGKSKTLNSNHLKWLAVDWIFLNSKWQPTWKGDYLYLHLVGKMFWMRKLTRESCHLEFDWRSRAQIMTDNSRWRHSADAKTQALLKNANDLLRA